MSENLSAYCPECDSRIRFGKRPRIGDDVSCPECRASLMVIDSAPIELDWSDMSYQSENHELFGDFNEWEDNWQD